MTRDVMRRILNNGTIYDDNGNILIDYDTKDVGDLDMAKYGISKEGRNYVLAQ